MYRKPNLEPAREGRVRLTEIKSSYTIRYIIWSIESVSAEDKGSRGSKGLTESRSRTGSLSAPLGDHHHSHNMNLFGGTAQSVIARQEKKMVIPIA